MDIDSIDAALPTKGSSLNVIDDGRKDTKNVMGVAIPFVDLGGNSGMKEGRTDEERQAGLEWWGANKGKAPKEVVFMYPWDRGGGGAGGAVYVTAGDLERLEPGKLLSDSLVMFGIKLALTAVNKRNKRVFESVHVFSNFFYNKLKTEGYGKVKKWTKGVDIFTKDVLLIPVNEGKHWFLALIVDPGRSVEIDDCERTSKDSSMQTRTLIITLDSVGYCHNALWDRLGEYLLDEAREKRGCEVVKPAGKCDLKVAWQMNGWDCGLYVIHFTEMILSNMKYYKDMMRKATEDTDAPQWEMWKVQEVLGLREKLIQEASRAGRGYEAWRSERGDIAGDWNGEQDVEVIETE
ncbi:cysteine proteinase [Hymenopellis radicata]|nr:cysteine proteinase [Hymenopellis radicata]